MDAKSLGSMNPAPESKPQGSEQPLNPCQHCDESQVLEFGHSQGQIRVECPCGASGPWCDTFNAAESQWNKVNPLPSPSADEEVETPLVDAAFAEYPVMDTQRGGDAITIQAARSIEKHLRQQHNAEREEFIESAVARDKKADEDRDAYESLINELKAQLEAARTQCALRSAGHDDLRTRLNKANAQKTALYFENSDALAELQQLRASLAEVQSELATAQKEIEQLKQKTAL